LPTRAGYEFDGWFTTANFAGTAEAFPYTVNADTAFYAKWTALYAVSYVVTGGTPNIPTATVRAGTTLSTPTTLTRAGYEFDGWYTTSTFEGSAVTFPYTVNEDTTFYAKWTALYIVTYVVNGGTPTIAAATVRAGTELQTPTALTRAGYEFDGWYTTSTFTGTAVRFPHEVNAHITLYAKWTALYTVSYVVNGGTPSIPTVTVRAGISLLTPTTLTRSGYEFDGWYTTSTFTGTAVIFPYTVNANTTFYAKWTALYTVTYTVNGGTPSIPTVTVRAGTSLTTPTTLTRSGYEFDGWYTTSTFTGTAVTFPYTVNANTNFYAKWTALYTVTYVVNSGTPSIPTATVRAGTSLSTPTTLTRANYEFDGWYTTSSFTGTAVTFPYTVNANTTFYAKWTRLYTVDFEVNGGTGSFERKIVRDGTSLAALEDPIKYGYAFDGWFINSAFTGSAAVFPYTVTADVTFYAKWTVLHTVTFNRNGGTSAAIDTQTIRGSGYATLPANPTRNNYVFAGWTDYSGSSPLSSPVLFPLERSGETPTSLTLYGTWISVSDLSDASKRTSYYNSVMKNSIFNSNLKVTEIAMLGAHDAFTHGITSSSSWNELDDNYSMWASLFGWAGVKSISARFSKAQSYGAYDLAKYGVRFFDGRITYQSSTWYTAHGLISGTVESYVQDMIKFLSENPREFLVFDVQKIFTGSSNHAALLQKLASITYNGKTIYDYVYYDTNVTPFSQLTYGEVIKNGGGVIMTFDSLPSGITYGNKVYYRGGAVYSDTWANTESTSTLINTINANYTKFVNGTVSVSGKFIVNQAQLTPQVDAGFVTAAIFNSDNLIKRGNSSNASVIAAANFTNWFSKMNVIWVDEAAGETFNKQAIPIIHTVNLARNFR
jgi:uncharacterized repeat protein (TIGR02543 family)